MLSDLPLETIVLAAFLTFCRIGTCFMLMPGLSSVRVAMHVRLFATMAVTWAVLVHLWDIIVPFVDRTPDSLLLLIVSEMLIGGTIGLVTRFYMLALQFAGSVIAMVGGFGGIAGSMTEDNDTQAALAAIITMSALLLLFVLNFHHEVFKALVQSYEMAPPGRLYNPQGALVDIVDTLSQSFYVILRLASPFIAYAIVINLAIGFLNKLTPQIPVYFISLPFVIAGTLLLAYFGIEPLLSLFGDSFVPTTIGR